MASFAIVGAGHVADLYMRSAEAFPEHRFVGVWDENPDRLSRFSAFWNVPAARGLDDLFTGAKRPDLLLNLTSPQSHAAVSHAALEAGLHVYSEAPLALDLGEARALVDRARAKQRLLSAAPCNALGAAAQAMGSALRRRLIGTPHLVYAEMDAGYLAQAPHAQWVSESGAPWPMRSAFTTGVALDQAGYALSWLLALFGPVRAIQALSTNLIDDKLGDATPTAPDFALALLRFDDDVVARFTHSTVASEDHCFRIFGARGVLSVGDVRRDGAKVNLLRRNTVRRRLVEGLVPERVEVAAPKAASGGLRGAAMNLMLGPHDMIEAIAEGRDPRLSADYALHLAEVTLAIQNAGDGASGPLSTTFEPQPPMAWARPKQRRRAMDENAIKLGIVGTGAMAATMRDALRHAARLDVVAVCSGNLDRAEAFATRHEVEQAYGDLEAMLASSGVDAVYVANATPDHAATAIAALRAGKATLVEKPFAVSLAEADAVLAAASESGALLMEALWTPFLPAHVRALELAHGGTLGEPLHLAVDFGYPATPDSAPRLFDRAAGGGVLLDRMIYPLGLALTLFGPVAEMDAAITFSGEIDTHASLQLRHASGGISQLAASLVTLTSNTATISCTGGMIRIEEPVLGAERVSHRAMGPQPVALRDDEAAATAPPPGQATRAQVRARLKQSGLARRVGRAVPSMRSETCSFGADRYLPMLTHFEGLIEAQKRESDIITHTLSRTVQQLLDAARSTDDEDWADTDAD